MSAPFPEHAVLDPQSIDAEHALLGSLLIDRDAISAVDWLTPAAFGSVACGHIFESVLTLWRRREPADFQTVADDLQRCGRLDACGGHAFLSALTSSVPTAVHAPYYARQVAHYAKRRRVYVLGEQLVQGVWADAEFDPLPTVRAALDDADALGDPAERRGPVAYADLMPDFQRWMLDSWDGLITEWVVPTGFRWLDEALDGGFRRGELALLAGRPGSGKTAFGLQLGHAAARHRGGDLGAVVVFSAEMSARSLLRRAVAEATGVSPPQIRSGKVPQLVRERVFAATERMADWPVAIDDTSGITTDQMIARVQRAQRAGPVALVLFDYVEIAGDRDQSEERRVGKIGGQLKHLARVCDVPVVALCQLSREVERRKDRRPQMSDLRYSGSLEAHADIVLMLYREGYYVAQGLMDATPGKEDVVDVIVAKQRNGVTGTFPVRWYPESMRFSDLDVDRRFE